MALCPFPDVPPVIDTFAALGAGLPVLELFWLLDLTLGRSDIKLPAAEGGSFLGSCWAAGASDNVTAGDGVAAAVTWVGIGLDDAAM